MAIKTYRAKTVISTCVLIGKSVMHIKFNSHSYGGSVFTTNDVNIQNALEANRNFGSTYILESVTGEEEKKNKTTETGDASCEEKDVNANDSGKKTVDVSDIEEAKDYLEEHFGIKRAAMRRKAAVEEIASSYGIEFKGM